MLKFLLCLCFFFCTDTTPQTQVWTNVGNLKGKWMTSRDGNPFLAFYGIPYAKPPLGDLRFKDPEEFGRWEGMRDATEIKEDCVQLFYIVPGLNATGSEDCLYLNIFTPDTKYGSLLPVIVYFHGGAFEVGNAVRGPEYWMDEKVVLVAVSYRLGPFGFLSFGDAELPGNMGLRDQLMALKWVRQNIPAFGGHPKRITVMGESAGGISVNLHMVSPLSRGLFQQALSMSGTVYNSWSWLKPAEARRRAQRTAELAGCLYNSTREAVDCLRTKSAYKIAELRYEFTTNLKDPLVFYGPVVDSASAKPFIPTDPNLLQTAEVPWINGYTSADGLLRTELYPMPFNWNEINNNFTSYLKVTEFFSDIPEDERKVTELWRFYFGDQPLTNSSYQNMTNLFTDAGFFIPVIQSMTMHKGPLFIYDFDYIGKNSYAYVFGSRKVAEGACHGDQDIYLWNETSRFPPLQGDDITFSKSLVKLWVNFAKYGSPTTKDSVINWPCYGKSSKICYMYNGGFLVQKDHEGERERFWQNLNT